MEEFCIYSERKPAENGHFLTGSSEKHFFSEENKERNRILIPEEGGNGKCHLTVENSRDNILCTHVRYVTDLQISYTKTF
jgi:hypothetical protein